MGSKTLTLRAASTATATSPGLDCHVPMRGNERQRCVRRNSAALRSLRKLTKSDGRDGSASVELERRNRHDGALQVVRQCVVLGV